MSDSSVEAALEICDFLDTLLLIAKHDRAPMRAISLLEQARSELQDYLDKTDRDDPSANWSRSGRGRRPRA
jgi:ribosomal protein S15P/S13E